VGKTEEKTDRGKAFLRESRMKGKKECGGKSRRVKKLRLPEDDSENMRGLGEDAVGE